MERKCLNKAVKGEDGEESEEEEEKVVADISSLLNKSSEKTPKKTKTKGKHKDVEWLGESVTTKRKTLSPPINRLRR